MIRQLKQDHLLTLICDSLTGISKFARLGDNQFKVIKKLIPGPYTFVLPATKEVPKLLLNPRTADHRFPRPGLSHLPAAGRTAGDPLIATTARHPDYEGTEGNGTDDRLELFRRFEKQVDLIVDNEQPLLGEPSTIVDMSRE
jgi:tRNA threonylcarbamoyl adenosine modification protein (Sua5/YciO/YrdC/YwlC family)